MTVAAKAAGTLLAVAAITSGALIIGLVLMIHTRERKIAIWAGEEDE